MLNNAKEGDTLSVVVIRKDKNGNDKELTLVSKMRKIKALENNVLKFEDNADAKQLKIRNSWLGEN